MKTAQMLPVLPVNERVLLSCELSYQTRRMVAIIFLLHVFVLKNEKYQLNFFKLRNVSLDFLKVASFQKQLGID